MHNENKIGKKSDGLHKNGENKLNTLRAVKLLIPLVIAFLLFFRFMMGVSLVSGNSMYPTLKNGQPVFYSRLSKEPQRGDIVSIRMPSGEYVIKRVIALPGELIEIRDGKVFINGKQEEQTYVNGDTFTANEKEEFSITVPEACIFIMGDNRSVSVDSRTYGAVAIDQIRGRLFSSK